MARTKLTVLDGEKLYGYSSNNTYTGTFQTDSSGNIYLDSTVGHKFGISGVTKLTIDSSGNLTLTGGAVSGANNYNGLIIPANTGEVTSGIWSGTAIVEIRGGTNQITYTKGDILYASALDTLSKLSGNITSSKLFLSQTGTGSISAAPMWSAIIDGDIPSSLTGKTYNGLTLTSLSTGFSIAGGTTSKTLTVDLTLIASTSISLTGTSNRISTTGSTTLSAGGSVGTIDISASYVGQSSITTLGTVGTGTWNAGSITTNSVQGAVIINPFNTSAGNTGELRFLELAANGTNYVGFKSPDSLAGNVIYTLPIADGSAGFVLTTDGSKNLVWASGSGSVAGSGTIGTLPYFSGTATLADSPLTRVNSTTVAVNTINVVTGVFTGTVSTTQLTATVGSGTPPLVISSSTMVTNLNANWLGSVNHGSDYFWPCFSLGEIVYSNSSGNPERLLGQTTTAKLFLSQTGNGGSYPTGSAAPVWSAISASNIGSGAALTKTDDTNVTLTLGGTPTTCLLVAASLTLGWTGSLAISRGGSGQTTANAALNAFLPSQTGNSGKFLTTDGTDTSWATAGSGGGVVISVTGTTNRITSSGGTTPAIDIAATYVGQSSITTLGTITTGAWHGTKIPEVYGGTDQTTYTTGDILYSDNTDSLAKLSGNTTTSRKFLRQVGDGVDSAAPAWDALVTGDIPSTLTGKTSWNGFVVTANTGVVTTGTWNAGSISTNNVQGAIVIKPFNTSAGNTSELRFLELAANGTNYVGFKAPDTLGGDVIFILPDADGSAGQLLTTDGSKNLSWVTASGTGTVTSVTGTTNRITSSGGATPAIDISASYVGQSSLTTLGTITTGTWNGTTIAIANGGTGQTSAANAFNALAPTTTKGDLIAYSTTNARVAVGTNGKPLTADSSAATGIAWKDCFGLVPIGGIVAWHEHWGGSDATLSEDWAKCDGSNVSDAASPFNGVATPALNNNNYFIRGEVNSTNNSGTTSSPTHTHSLTIGTTVVSNIAGTTTTVVTTLSTPTGATAAEPKYMNFVYIIRIK